MATMTTKTLVVTINAPFERVAADLADPMTHPEWAKAFFSGPARESGRPGEVIAPVPMMGGDVSFKIESDTTTGIFDLFLAPVGGEYGPPLPVRLIPNGDGVDVLWTLGRLSEMPDEAWEAGLVSMAEELIGFKSRHETGVK